MSFLFKLVLIISYTYFPSYLSFLNQSPNYDNFFSYNNSPLNESYLFDYLKIDELSYKLGFSKDFFANLVQFAFLFWAESKFIPSTYLFNKNVSECYNGLVVDTNNSENRDSFNELIEGNGKYLNDLGNEHFCLSINNFKSEYFLFQAYFGNITLTNDEDKILLKFLAQNFFSMGFCLPEKCTKIINQLNEEKELKDFIFWKLNVSNFTIYNHKKKYKELKSKYKYGHIYKYSFYFICLVKFIVGLLRTIIITKGYERYYIDDLEKEKKKKSISLVYIDSKKSESFSDSDEKEDEKDEEIKLIENNNDNVNEKNRKIVKNKLSPKLNETNNDIREMYVDYIYGASAKNENNLYDPFYDNQDKYPLKIKIIKYIDLFDNIKILITIANKYYNSCNIKKIYFLKFITMFMAMILKIILVQVKMPNKNFLVHNFYQSFRFFLIKICIFSSIFWIVLDALTTGFKLMSYIKKKIVSSKNNNLTFATIFKFLLLLIPKMALFLICFSLLHIHANYLTFSLINSKHMSPFLIYYDINYNYTYSAKYAEENLIKGIKYIFPIYINYIDYFQTIDKNKEFEIDRIGSNIPNPSGAENYTYYKFDRTGFKIPSPFLTNTELFINIYLNEFVLLIFMLIITYLSYIIRKKLFDYFLLGINIVLYIIPIFNWTKYNNKVLSDENNKYYLFFVLGQYFSEKYTHYFINFYYFGFIIGVMMFYHNENIFAKYNSINIINNNNDRNNSLSRSHNSSYDGTSSTSYNSNNNLLNILPFSFCNSLIMVLHKLKFYIKRIILWLCLLGIFLMSITFYLIQKYFQDEKEKEELSINIKITKLKFPELSRAIIKYIFLYEKNVCCIFFFIFLLMFIVYPPNTNLVKFSQLKFFILFDRINFSFYCTYSFLVYAAFCIFYVEFKITYVNVFLNSLGIFIFTIAINIIVVCIFELPFRMYIKTQMNKNTEKDFRMTFGTMELLSPSNRITNIK